jgi:hypothetical protein
VELLVEEVDVLLELVLDVEVLDEVELDVLVDVVDDVVVVVCGFAASAGTTITSASRTLHRPFPPG